MLEQVHREAGVIGMVLFAGPDVVSGGNIVSMGYVLFSYLRIVIHLPFLRMHMGRTPAGNQFPDVYKDFAKNIDAPFQKFAALCYREFALSLRLTMSVNDL
jgi:hypothetical protein